jgi:hypothetical protein
MNTFLQRHLPSVTGMLSGFDRIRFRGTFRMLAHKGGFASFLKIIGVKLEEFGKWVEQSTDLLRRQTEQTAQAAGRPMKYLPSPSISKENVARQIAAEDGIKRGLICVLSATEPCFSYHVRQRGSPQLGGGTRRCLHYYHYMIDPYFGFMHVRVQSWMPMVMHICINGREWLSRRMDEAGMKYLRADNCFLQLSDPQAAQSLLDRMLRTDWPGELNRLAKAANPASERILANCGQDYYWSVEESEWASDVMFKSPALLKEVYPNLVRHGMLGLGSRDVLRFLGRKVSMQGKLNARLIAEVSTDLHQRVEGLRVKHRVASNSIKMYDKQGSVLRVETTINKPRDMKVYRPKEGDEEGEKDWRYLRKGVADTYRRAQICQASNERYLTALAAVDHPTPLGKLVDGLCRPVKYKGPRAKKSRQVRGLNPLAKEDATLLEAVSQGQFTLTGFRNKDIRALLFTGKASDSRESRRRSGAVTRKLRLLRAHGLIRKMPRTSRYVISDHGRVQITALLTARAADSAKLAAAA